VESSFLRRLHPSKLKTLVLDALEPPPYLIHDSIRSHLQPFTALEDLRITFTKQWDIAHVGGWSDMPNLRRLELDGAASILLFDSGDDLPEGLQVISFVAKYQVHMWGKIPSTCRSLCIKGPLSYVTDDMFESHTHIQSLELCQTGFFLPGMLLRMPNLRRLRVHCLSAILSHDLVASTQLQDLYLEVTQCFVSEAVGHNNLLSLKEALKRVPKLCLRSQGRKFDIDEID
jgi:hypothetical protein